MTFQMTKAQAAEHQRKNGFNLPPELQDGAKAIIDFAGNKKRGAMNKTEHEFSLILEAQKQRGEIVHYVYEGIRLKWGETMHYTGDFAVFIEDMPTKIIEVKGGYINPRDLVRFKGCSAEWRTWFDFELHQKREGQWVRLY